MEFRANLSASRQNELAAKYFIEGMSDVVAAKKIYAAVRERLGNAVASLPDWHPILSAPPDSRPYAHGPVSSISELETYACCDHTRQFVRGILTCPYDEVAANDLVEAVNHVNGLHAERLDGPLYADGTFPVIIEAVEIILEADGTIRSRDALAWFVLSSVKYARQAQVGETWWNLRASLLGSPHGARSSLVVSDYTGRHMRKILEALNESELFGPVKEWSLDMISERKRDTIGNTLIQAALDAGAPLSGIKREARKISFELRGEKCQARISDTWEDGMEYAVQVTVGDDDLYVSGFYYPANNKLEHIGPKGKRKLAEKFG